MASKKKMEMKAEGMSELGAVTGCSNLRATRRGLEPVGLPPIAGVTQATPFHTHRHSDGSVSVFARSGRQVMVIRNGKETFLGMTDGAPLTAESVASTVTVMDTTGCPAMAVLSDDGQEWEWLGMMPCFDGVAVTAAPLGVVTQTLPERDLKGSYTKEASGLSTTDQAALTADAVTVYDRLEASAASLGGTISPVMARVAIYGRHGDLLHHSMPVLLVPEDGVVKSGFDREVTFDGTGWSHVAATKVSAMAFRAQLTVGSSVKGWEKWVSSIAVEVSDPVPVVDFNGVSSVRLGGFSATAAVLTMTLPGCPLGGGYSALFCRRVGGMIDRVDDVMHAVGSVGPEVAVTAFNLASAQGAETAARAIDVAVKSVADTSAALKPGFFTAAKSATSGNVVVWADVITRAYDALTPANVAAAVDAGGWSGYSHVKFRGEEGQSLTVTSVMSKLRPLSLSPLVVYPDARASEVTFVVDNKITTVALQPTPGGTGAWALATDLRPVAPDGEVATAVVPAHNPPLSRDSSKVAVGDVASPLRVTAVTDDAAGAVTAVTSARSASSLDMTRVHFYVLGSKGIAIATVSGNRGSISARLLTSSMANGEEAVALTDNAVAVASGGRVIMLRNGSISEVARPGEMVSLAWDSHHGELWMMDGTGHVMVWQERYGSLYKRSLVASTLTSAGGEVVVHTGNSLRITANEESYGALVTVAWEARRRVTFRPEGLLWDVWGSDIRGMLSLTADGGSRDQGRLLSGVSLSGMVDHPLRMSVVAPRRAYLSVAMEAAVSGDTVISGVSIYGKD